MLPLLLVSVRSSAEAVAAVHGGSDIIDIKEPANGALGSADAATMREICEVTRGLSGRISLSAALGELQEWCGLPDDRQRDVLEFLSDPDCPIQYLKMGSAGLAQRSAEGRKRQFDAASEHDRVRAFFRRPARCATLVRPLPDVDSGQLTSGPRWVSVAYADNVRACAPPVLEMAREAVSSGCAGLLVDTWIKDGSGLTSWCSGDELRRLREVTREAGIWLALAGQLTVRCLSAVREAEPDIVAVRGAVCESGSRGNSVSELLVRRFSAALRESDTTGAATDCGSGR